VQTAPDRTAGVKLEGQRADRLVGLRGIWVDLIRWRGPDCFVSSVFAVPEIFTHLSFSQALSSAWTAPARARVRFRVLADD
jgi:hypothetical protein